MKRSDPIIVHEGLQIPAWELQERFVRASGPGGQHVNKVSTAVQLRWNVMASSIPADIKARFRRRYGARLSTAGDLILEASAHRSQLRNRQAVRDRLKQMLAGIAKPPSKRLPTRPTHGAVHRRIERKKQRSEIKSLRGKIKTED